MYLQIVYLVTSMPSQRPQEELAIPAPLFSVTAPNDKEKVLPVPDAHDPVTGHGRWLYEARERSATLTSEVETGTLMKGVLLRDFLTGVISSANLQEQNHYIRQGRLGEGGLATVFKAWDCKGNLGYVAVKVLKRHSKAQNL